MARSPIWRAIADTLTAEIARAHYAPGDRLPTEAELADRFGVNRHTVRHALAALTDQGLIHTRRGSGAFVAARPADYALGRRTRFHQNLAAAGRNPARDITRRETRPADAGEAAALNLQPGDAVHVIEGVSTADGVPMAAFRSVFPAAQLPGLLARLDPSGRAMAATPAMLMVGAAIGPILGGTLVKLFGYGSLGVAALVIAAVAVFCFSCIPSARREALGAAA